jgi:acyl-CoA oxidase
MTATYDMTSDEIILNSPSITAYKFWPGELGYHTNFPIVVAKLIVNGEDKGV